MNCEQVQKVLEAFIHGKMSGDESRLVRLHLASCAACASKLSLADRVEALPVFDDAIEPSEDFAARFRARLQERKGSSKEPYVWWKRLFASGRPLQLSAAGALVMLLVAGIFFVRQPGDSSRSIDGFSDFAIAENLYLLKDMAVINNLDLLEDFDAIEQMTPGLESSKDERSIP